MGIKIALAGNPNSGKTTLFNALTGSNQFVGNWPGVTVEKKEGKLKSDKSVVVTDLPGIYSLSPYTLEEVVARNYLIKESPDVILNIVDGTNIERNLYLTTQLIEMGIPVVVAINMMDVVEKSGDKIDISELSKALECEIVQISALKGSGIDKAAAAAIKAAGTKAAAPTHEFSDEVETVLKSIEDKLAGVPNERKRYFAVKLFERDEKIGEQLQNVPNVENIITATEHNLDDDSESIITNERYNYITGIVADSVKIKSKGRETISDKIDKIVTNRILALPLFALVMFIVYFISVTTVGTLATDWANDGVFGDGWHLFGIGGGQYEEASGEYETEIAKRDAYIEAVGEAGVDTAPVTAELESEEPQASIIDDFAAQTAPMNVVGTAEIENEDGEIEETIPVDHPTFVQTLGAEEPDPANFGVWVPGIPVLVDEGLAAIGTADWLHGLIMDGIVGGVGAVLGFVPQMLILFIFLAFLEGCGYMARVAFIMDRIFRKFGLSGKSFIPMLIGTGCGVPGIMASRTIENDRDRKMTIITTTFIPCGAKLPIIALIAGALFGGAWWVAPSAYFIGIFAIVLSGIMLKKTKLFAGDVAPFVMELPAYHMPTIGNVLRSMWERGWSFIKKAGTIVLLSSVFIWFTSSFGIVDGKFGMVDDFSQGFLCAIGNVMAPIFAPLGWGHWQAAVATVTGLVAKENVVGTFGVLYGFAEVAENGKEIWSALASDFSGLSAFSFLVFNLLCAPCFAAMGAIRREMNNRKWTLFAIGYQTGFAYIIALCVFQIGGLFTGAGFGIGTAAAFIALAAFVWLLAKPAAKAGRLKKA